MIDLSNWRCSNVADIETKTRKRIYKKAFVGSSLDIDDRSKWVGRYANQISDSVEVISFDFLGSKLNIGDISIPVGELENIEPFGGPVLVDATSLAFPELLYLFLMAKETKQNFDVLYLEPAEYSSTEDNTGDIRMSRFALSEDGPGINMLQRFTYPVLGSYIVVALGFEGHRFGALLQSDEFEGSSFSGLLGIPPFYTGWEGRSYIENADVMDQVLSENRGSFEIAGANDPCRNYKLLEHLYDSWQGQGACMGFHLAPFGTKPTAVSMAWFAVNNEGVGVLYDFIKKKDKRTTGYGKVHWWRFTSVV